MALSFSRRLGMTFLLLSVLIFPLLVSAQGDPKQGDTQALAEAIAPPRDRVSLAQRFLGVSEVPPNPTTPEEIYSVGDVDTFWAQNLDTGVFQIEAEMVYTNEHLYIWVEQGERVDLADVQHSADRFSTDVYEQTRSVFGSEAAPGIDGDPKLHILFSSRLGSGIAAYYYSESEYPQEAVSTSNEREMFFVNLDTMRTDIGSDYFVGVLAHEFQHMIQWALDGNETSWLNEGLSELAAYLGGFGVSPFARGYPSVMQEQLTYSPQNELKYGGSFLFNLYIYERYGTEAIRTLVADPANGMESVQAMLDALGATNPATGEPMTAELLYTDFVLALYLRDTGIEGGLWGFSESEINNGIPQIRPTTTYNNPTDFILEDTALKQWGVQFYRVQAGATAQTYHLSFTGNATIGLLPVNAHSGRYAVWSNRFDNSDTRITREFDLTGLSNATLNFWTWYDIEQDWDYAYVAVSSDNGATWATLVTERTTDTNPHNTSFGNGYTGASGDWVEQTIDLSAYAGQKIQVRFEYITDDAAIENGMLIDDVSIPELGYTEDFEAGLDWNAEGWVRIENSIEQSFSIQVIEKYTDGTIQVRPLLSPTDGITGEWDLTIGGDLSEIVMVLSAFAPYTTESATINMRLTTE